MIAPYEIRIGNIVSYNNQLCRVTAIDEHSIKAASIESNEYHELEPESFSPVKLTPDLVQKFGFEDDIAEYDHKDFYPLLMFKNGICYADMGDGSYFVELKYLHQLQNLYFDITGKELEVNL